MENVKIAELIRNGETVLGMEFGSTRIKAVLIDAAGNPLASGSQDGRTVWKIRSGLTA